MVLLHNLMTFYRWAIVNILSWYIQVQVCMYNLCYTTPTIKNTTTTLGQKTNFNQKLRKDKIYRSANPELRSYTTTYNIQIGILFTTKAATNQPQRYYRPSKRCVLWMLLYFLVRSDTKQSVFWEQNFIMR